MITELSKRRVFRVISGYAVVCFVILQIADVAAEPLGIGNNGLRIMIAGMLLALPLVAYLSWRFDVEPDASGQRSARGKPWLEASITLVAMAILAIGAWFVLTSTPLEPDTKTAQEQLQDDLAAPTVTDQYYSIAVLPFDSTSSSEELDFVADGLSEEILNNLAQLEQLKVASRSASFQFAGRGHNPTEVGKQLGVSYLLEGSVRQRGETLRITAQLIRANDGSHVWAKTYERPAASGFDMQTAVAANVAHIAQSELDHDIFAKGGWKQWDVLTGIDPAAVKHFIDALNEWRKLGLGEGGSWDANIQYLKQAIAVDPDFATGYVQLAHAINRGHSSGRLPLQVARAESREAIDQATKLQPNDYLLLMQRAIAYIAIDLDYAQANTVLERLLELEPRDPWTHYLFANVDLREGRTSAALKRLVAAESSDTSLVFAERALLFTATSFLRCMARDCERALDSSGVAVQLTTGGEARANALGVHALNLLTLGKINEARPFVNEGWHQEGSINPDRYFHLFAQMGEFEKARNILSNPNLELTQHFYVALGHLALGNIDNTFTAIEAGIEEHNAYLIMSLLTAPWWDSIRNDPRFDEMLALLDSKVIHTQEYLREKDQKPPAR